MKTAIKKGTRVRHIMSGDLMTVVSVSGGKVALCRRDVPITSDKFGMIITSAVCHVSNLETI